MLDLALRSTLILMVAWTVARVLYRATAATRHRVWHGALLAILSAPLLAPIVPKYSIPQLPDSVNTTLAALPGITRSVPGSLRPATANGIASQPSAATRPHSNTTQNTISSLSTLGTLGALVTLIWFSFGWLAAARSVRRAQTAPAAWQLEINRLRQRLRIRREVRLAITSGNGSPLAVGLWRPTVLLPHAALTWDTARRHTVLLHELAHVRRGDCRIQALTQAACVIYWFNPLVWIAAAHLRAERERACDDEVLRTGAQPSAYAAILLDIARELRPTFKPSAALAMARPSELEGRLLGILAAERARVPAPGSRWAIATTLALATAAVLGAAPAATVVGAPAATTTPSWDPLVVPFQESAPDTDREGIGRLQRALNDVDQDVREKAALQLAFRSGSDVIPALLTALRDSDSQVREKAAIGLALRRDERIIDPLLDAMTDADAQVREKVAIALGASGHPRAAAALEAALKDSDAQVREKASAGLVLLAFTQQ